MTRQNKSNANGKTRSRGYGLPKVVDAKSAADYNSRLMHLIEKEKIAPQVAKHLSYHIQLFSMLRKMMYEEEQVRILVEFSIEQLKNEISIRLKNFMEALSPHVSADILTVIENDLSTTEKDVVTKINLKNEEIYENIKKRTSYRITESVAEMPDNLVELIKSAAAVLPYEKLEEVAKFLITKKNNPLTK